MTSYEAVWVPDDDPRRPWDDAAAPVAAWVADRARDLGVRPLLVTHGNNPHNITRRFTWGKDWFSHRSHSRPARNAPTISYVPEAEDFEFARRLAGNTALGVIEGKSFPLGGWAAEVGATNLWTAQITPPLDTEARKLLERLALFGNNGYSDDFGKKTAERLLQDLRATGIEPELIPGALAAHDVSARGQDAIAKMLDA